ncbi:MAG TPA: MotA/TolQ/ExbB proton channel family protein [Candidatus Binataceae bacterium]|jgi:biopolymer transport protein ExbB/TolQ|nr:MotA/TolQ/ExbB proton channel family protein [Candidatus Binataceae bacterium]
MGSQFSILAMIQQGYYATYPLLFISVVCLAIIFERIWALMGIQGRAAKLADSLVPTLRQGKFNEALQATQARANPAERVYHVLVAAAQTLDRDHLVELDEERRFQETIELNRYVWVLATAGASAPFIGLFGTVVGILVAFQSMAIMGTGGFSVVAAGISEALISTALGLAVAIVAVIFFNYFSVKIQNINALLQINGDRLIDAALQGRQGGGR